MKIWKQSVCIWYSLNRCSKIRCVATANEDEETNSLTTVSPTTDTSGGDQETDATSTSAPTTVVSRIEGENEETDESSTDSTTSSPVTDPPTTNNQVTDSSDADGEDKESDAFKTSDPTTDLQLLMLLIIAYIWYDWQTVTNKKTLNFQMIIRHSWKKSSRPSLSLLTKTRFSDKS